MDSFISFMEKRFLPVVAKVGNQRHLPFVTLRNNDAIDDLGGFCNLD